MLAKWQRAAVWYLIVISFEVGMMLMIMWVLSQATGLSALLHLSAAKDLAIQTRQIER